MRLDDWPARLAAAIDAAKDRGFQYGRHDCLRFAAHCEIAVCGSSRIEAAFHQYDCRRSAFLLLGRHGFRSVPELLDNRYERINVRRAQRGDWVCFDHQEDPLIGVVNGNTTEAPARVKGLLSLPTLEAVRAWRIE